MIENLELSVEQFRKSEKSKRIYRISPSVSSPNPLQLTPDSSRDAAEPLLLLGAEAFDSPVSWFGSNPTINKIYWVEGSLRWKGFWAAYKMGEPNQIDKLELMD